jgi:hypothetical protein
LWERTKVCKIPRTIISHQTIWCMGCAMNGPRLFASCSPTYLWTLKMLRQGWVFSHRLCYPSSPFLSTHNHLVAKGIHGYIIHSTIDYVIFWRNILWNLV